VLAIGGMAVAAHWAPQAADGQARAQAASSASHGDASNTDTDGKTNDDVPQGEHGAAVSAVAQDVDLVGGPNDNHGGAVSIVARGDHGAPSDEGDSSTHRQDGTRRP
jgi:hypothetical protein